MHKVANDVTIRTPNRCSLRAVCPPQHHPEVTAIYLGNRGKVGPVGYLETDGDVTGCSLKKTWPQNPKYIVKKVHKPLG